MPKKFIITGGGTGGHVFPALTIASEIKARGHQVLYIGSDRGFEARLAPEYGIELICIHTGPIKNQTLWVKLRSLMQLLAATAWSLKILRSQKASAVIGVGGYISVPVCVAAFILRIPVFIQEQNASVGIANRFLGRLASHVYLGFVEGARYFAKNKATVTGNPIRSSLARIDLSSYKPSEKRILVMGGSQGAKPINDAVLASLSYLKDYKIQHQVGERDFDRVSEAYRMAGHKSVEVVRFIKDVAEAFRLAAFVISRSGALTVTELIQVCRPALLVPYPRIGQNDQVDNAKMLQSHGAAICVEQGDKFEQRFVQAIETLTDPAELMRMAAGYSPLHRSNAVGNICDHIESSLATHNSNG